VGSIHGFTRQNDTEGNPIVAKQTLPKTAPVVIREAAQLITEKGFNVMRGNTTAHHLGLFGISLVTAVTWAVHGGPCRQRDLSPQESEWVAEVLDQLADELRMEPTVYESRFCNALPQNISSDLRLAAWNLERKLGLK
jgi:hypothetical protein